MTKKGKAPKAKHAADIGQVLADINRELGGKALVRPASEVYRPFHIRRPTGIASIDMGIGGGFPAASINQLFGPAGACKNYLADRVIANVQKNYGSEAAVFFASFGYNYDKGFGQLNGVSVALSEHEIKDLKDDLAERGGVLEKTVERELRTQIGTFVEISLGPDESAIEKPSEHILNAVLKLIQSGRFQVGILDETNIGETRFGVVKDLGEDPRTADLASLLTAFLKKFYSVIKSVDENGEPNKTTLIEILEVRSKLTSTPVRYGEPLSQGGGHALKHAKAIDLHLRPGARIMNSGKAIGKEINWRVAKAKLGVHEGAEGSFQYHWGVGVDEILDLVNACKIHNVFELRGPWVYYEGEKLAQGVANVAALLREDPTFEANLRDTLFKSAKVSCKVTG